MKADPQQHAVAVLSHDPISEETLDWLRSGLLEYLKTKRPLDQCLCINRAEYLRTVRNYYLVKAFSHIDPTESRFRRCLIFAEALKIFQLSWGSYKNLKDPDPSWPALKKTIFMAFKYGKPPATARMLDQIV